MTGMLDLLSRRPSVPTPAPPGTVAISAVEATVSRGGRPVLRGVSLDVRCGEVVAVVGPNGAGKSTMVSLLAGDLPPASGSVEAFGRPVGDWRLAELALRRAVLPQQTTVAFPFTVTQVVAMGRAPWSGTPLSEEDDEAIAEAMSTTETTTFAHRHFTELSGGERARVALARVLAQRTGCLLLDEPTAALDLRHQDLVMQVATARASSGCAVLVVLHDLNLAAAYAHRIALIAEARVVANGPPPDVLTAPLLTSVYHRDIEVIPHPRTGTPLILPTR